MAVSVISAANAQNTLYDSLNEGIEAGELEGLHSVIMLREGEVFFEGYFEGADERWGQPIGVRAHGPKTRHDLRSVTKSIVGLLYAIALEEEIVPDFDSSLLSSFPEYPDLADNPKRQKILIEHALTMTMGTEWNETLPYTDPNNSEIAMELAEDRYRFVLDRPIAGKPGEKWNYSGGATAVIGRLIAKGAKMPLDDYARTRLFEPLGITKFTWIKGLDGEPSAASGLRMRAPDLAKIGQMIVQDGQYNGAQIISKNALDKLLTPKLDIQENFRYGQFWYFLGPGSPPPVIAGFGNGGQRLSINKERKLVTVIFAGNYNDPNAWKVPVKVIEEYLVPELEKR